MKVHSQTDVGLVRTLNEDACRTGLLGENGAWAVVCDGMGGANGGEIASETAVKSIEEQILASYEEDFKSEEMKLMLSTLIFHANSAVYDMAQENESLKGMGTTIVVAIVLDNVAHIAHAGDSRAFRKGCGKEEGMEEAWEKLKKIIDILIKFCYAFKCFENQNI